MGAAAAGAGVAAGIAVAAGLMVLPQYLPSTAMSLDREIEEWSPAVTAADTVLTPKGLAAMVLEPNEVLGGSADERRPGGGLLDGR